MSLERWARRLWARPSGDGFNPLLWALSGLAGIYERVVTARARAYADGSKPQARLPVPVISVGNLSVGGTGKTPFTIFLARQLASQGLAVGILTRGYGGSNEGKGALLVADHDGVRVSASVAGDEAVLMAQRLPGVPVVACSRRVEGGQLLLSHQPVDVLLLDDGFQHLALARDVEMVLVDGAAPLGNGCLLPRGPLREPPTALARADWVVLTGGEHQAQAIVSGYTDAPVLAATTRVEGIFDCDGAPVTATGPVLAVSGIARPERFWQSCETLGVQLAGRLVYEDHTTYRPAQVNRLISRALACGAEAVLTTEKDGVKLAPLWPDNAEIPLWQLHIASEVIPLSGAADDWLQRLVAAVAKARLSGSS